MAVSKSVPRLLQPPRPLRAGASPASPGRAATKGDLRTQVEATKPNRDREVGDLEQSERETHGRAHGPSVRER